MWQVFIRTVLDNSDTAPTVVTVGGGMRSSIEGLGLVDDPSTTPELNHGTEVFFSYKLTEFDRQQNVCGCTNFHMKVMVFVTFVLFVIFFCGSAFGGVIALFALAIIALLVSIVGCILLMCPCCKRTTGLDE